MAKIAVKHYEDGVRAFYRPGSTDEKVLKEVIEKKAYRRASAGFDVEAGEHWLDLGANIGAFAIYCALKGATADCYEPEPACFNLLQRNVGSLDGFRCFNAAVSASQEQELTLSTSSIEGNHYRGTLLQGTRMRTKEAISVANVYAGNIKAKYDGVKMDIEGSEFGILDRNLLPRCNKLCFEYHTSRDDSCADLGRRIANLRKLFEVVSYTPELDRLIEKGGRGRSFHDRVIYCMGKK